MTPPVLSRQTVMLNAIKNTVVSMALLAAIFTIKNLLFNDNISVILAPIVAIVALLGALMVGQGLLELQKRSIEFVPKITLGLLYSPTILVVFWALFI